MRITVRLILVLAAVLLTAITLSEQPQSATANTGSDRAKSDLCNSVVEPARKSGPTAISADLLIFTGERRIAVRLPWNSFFHSHAVASGSGRGPAAESFNSSAPMISGLPAESVPPPARSLPALAQIVNVTVNNPNSFNPRTVRIAVGDTVRWTWNGGPHSVTSGNCLSDIYGEGSDCTANNTFCSPSDLNCGSGPSSNAGTVYSHQFNTPGTFPYFCNVHLGAMTGTVIVEDSGPTPTPTPTPTPSPTPQWQSVALTAPQ